MCSAEIIEWRIQSVLNQEKNTFLLRTIRCGLKIIAGVLLRIKTL
jgi:hypothetical protein